MSFVIFDRNLFVKLMSNMIDYMKDYEKTKLFSPKYSQSVLSQISTIKRIRKISIVKNRSDFILSLDRTKSAITRSLSSPDLLQTPLSTSSIRPTSANHEIDIRKYIITDPQRINNNSSPFSLQILTENENIYSSQMIEDQKSCLSIPENHPFNENDLVLFKQLMSSSFPLELKNCIHQLANDHKLDNREICDLLMKLDQQIISDKDIPKIIRNLQNAASHTQKEPSIGNLSNLMRILLRIDQLGKWNKLDSEKVRIFNERMNHL